MVYTSQAYLLERCTLLTGFYETYVPSVEVYTSHTDTAGGTGFSETYLPFGEVYTSNAYLLERCTLLTPTLCRGVHFSCLPFGEVYTSHTDTAGGTGFSETYQLLPLLPAPHSNLTGTEPGIYKLVTDIIVARHKRTDVKVFVVVFPKKYVRAWPRPSFFWHDTDFSRI